MHGLTRFLMIGCLAAGLALPSVGAAQDRNETLADIRQQLSVLFVEIQKLKRELSTTGAAGGSLDTSGSALQRLDSLEQETQRLTARTEELEFRVNRIVEDGTNRIGDLEFRLVELEGGDVSKLGETTTLGGGQAAPAPAPAQPVQPAETELAVSEEADFRRAQEALAKSDFRSAADLFAAFGETYPGSPLETEAQLRRGQALEGLGEASLAARSYLNAFSGAPNGPLAPEALFRLGRMLAELGQGQEACVTLREVGVRFPDSSYAAQAQGEAQSRNCQ